VGESVITVSELTRHFGDKTASGLRDLFHATRCRLRPRRCKRSSKTTLIKHILVCCARKAGSVRVFGLDPVADPVAVLSRIGYLSEENDLPAWMRVDELIRYSRAFYSAWDDAYAEELREAFALDPTAKIKSLSKGQKARAGLLIALAYRPELLVLDEPSSGLDPIVRRDILGAVHSHHRRRRPHGALLVASVGGSGAGCRSRHDDQSRQDCFERATATIKESHRVDGRVLSLDEIFVAHVGTA